MSVAAARWDALARPCRLELPRRSLLAAFLFTAAGQDARAEEGNGNSSDKPGGNSGSNAEHQAAAPSDIALLCNPTLVPFIQQAAVAFAVHTSARVAIFAAPPPLILAAVARGVAADVLVMPSAAMDQAVGQKLADPATRRDNWRSTLVLASVAGTVPPFAANNPALLLGALGMTGRFALTDASDASSLDGAAVLAQLGLGGSIASRTLGAPDTAGVVFLLKTGAAKLGLLYLTDVRASPGLAVACVLDPTRAPATTYAIALAQKPKSPHARAFVDLLCSQEMDGTAQAMGLERA